MGLGQRSSAGLRRFRKQAPSGPPPAPTTRPPPAAALPSAVVPGPQRPLHWANARPRRGECPGTPFCPCRRAVKVPRRACRLAFQPAVIEDPYSYAPSRRWIEVPQQTLKPSAGLAPTYRVPSPQGTRAAEQEQKNRGPAPSS